MALRTVEHVWRAMGTDCHVVATVEPGAADVVPIAVALVEQLEAWWSRFRPDSDISRINAGGAVPVAAATIDAVERALAARDATGGRFDPTVHAALVAAGYDRSFDTITTDPVVAGGGPRGGASVDVDRAAGTVEVEPGAGLDLGGIGKGLAADRVVELLLALPGVHGVLASMGGDLRCAGVAPAPSPDAWGIAVDDHGEQIPCLAVSAGGVATSTVTRRRWTTADGASAHHVIDPSTGRPARTAVRTATVVAAHAADAEVGATVALLDGPGAVDLPALVTDHEGRTTHNEALEPYLR